jgi:hypothetical protein
MHDPFNLQFFKHLVVDVGIVDTSSYALLQDHHVMTRSHLLGTNKGEAAIHMNNGTNIN